MQGKLTELRALMAGLSVKEFHELTSDIDNRLIGPDSRTAFLNLFSKKRVGELSVESKTKFIQALQQEVTNALFGAQAVAVNGGDLRGVFIQNVTGPDATARASHHPL